jgi:hypothetical protein
MGRHKLQYAKHCDKCDKIIDFDKNKSGMCNYCWKKEYNKEMRRLNNARRNI